MVIASSHHHDRRRLRFGFAASSLPVVMDGRRAGGGQPLFAPE
ncbi:hypothetical protein ACFFRL_03000 [Agromyces hippuratus]